MAAAERQCTESLYHIIKNKGQLKIGDSGRTLVQPCSTQV